MRGMPGGGRSAVVEMASSGTAEELKIRIQTPPLRLPLPRLLFSSFCTPSLQLSLPLPAWKGYYYITRALILTSVSVVEVGQGTEGQTSAAFLLLAVRSDPCGQRKMHRSIEHREDATLCNKPADSAAVDTKSPISAKLRDSCCAITTSCHEAPMLRRTATSTLLPAAAFGACRL